MEKYLRDREVAEILSIGRSTVWYYVKLGKLPQPIKLSQRVTIWKLSEIEELLKKRIN